MSRVYRAQSRAKERRQLLELVRHALEPVADQDESELELRDRIAFVLLTLARVHESVSATIQAWEKRGYWSKADRFQREWDWVGQHVDSLESALSDGSLERCAHELGELRAHMPTPEGPRGRKGFRPWQGAWRKWQALTGAE
jgi:hypothetical protein